MNAEQQVNQWGQIVAKAWQDDKFKTRLLAEPSAVLKEQGLDVAAEVQIRVVENTEKVLYFTLPAKPRTGELSDAEVAGVAGGALSRSLVQSLAKVFGWNYDQITQIENAAGGRVISGGGGGGGGDGADAGGE